MVSHATGTLSSTLGQFFWRRIVHAVMTNLLLRHENLPHFLALIDKAVLRTEMCDKKHWTVQVCILEKKSAYLSDCYIWRSKEESRTK